MEIKLETERLILQNISISHAEVYFDYLMRNADFFKKWSPEYEEDYFNIEHHKRNIRRIEAEQDEGKQIKFAVFLKDDPAKIAGTIQFANIVKGPFQSCFLGYRLDEKQNGNGYAAEAIGKGIEYMFNVVKLHRIEANIIPHNTASIRVAERLGFRLEGYSRNYLRINGKWQDHLHYVLLNE